MRIVTANEWQQWQAQAETLEQDSRGPKVLQLHDGHMLKIFRPRRRLWLARLFPQAQRFAANAAELQKRQICTPKIDECFWLDRMQAISACLYTPLPGTSLESLHRQSPAALACMLPELSAFIHTLHQRGIYFRSLHLGNILHLPDGRFGLIDFLDIRFKNGPLSSRLASRNLKHLQSYLQRRHVDQFPWQEFLQEYARR